MQIVYKEDISGFPLFQKVVAKVLLSGKRLTFVHVEIEPNGIVPEHSHPHEQMGICLEGKAEFSNEGKMTIVKAGMAYWIPSNEKHGVKVIGDKPGIFIDVFSPPREEYLSKQKEVAKLNRTDKRALMHNQK
jgi:quercetin dioxygenase-like cupin family protein